jgi:DNA-binding MarR family transcriptional regulator
MYFTCEGTFMDFPNPSDSLEHIDFSGLSEAEVIYGLLFAVSNKLQACADKVLPDITSRQHFLLIVLSVFKDKYPSLKEVAQAVGSSYQNVKKMADSLEKKGFLILKRDEHDKRKYNLMMTDKVAAFSEVIDEEAKAFMEHLYQGLTQDDLKRAISVLTQMQLNLHSQT